MKIYTDGACSGNPGPGGYGVVALNDEETEIILIKSNKEENTTNNIQELKALIYAFIVAKTFPQGKVIIYSDSAYAINVFTQWASNWEKNNWTKSDNKPIKNLDLIQKGYQIFSELSNCEIYKVAGHAAIPGNEMADALASNNSDKFLKWRSRLK